MTKKTATTTPEFEQYRQEMIAKRQRFGDKKIHFPDVVSFDQLFDGSGFDKKLVKPSGHPDISTFCWVSYIQGYEGPRPSSFYATPNKSLVEWIAHEMMYSCGIHFKIILYDDGTALLTAEYDQILGSRWLALIKTETVPAIKPEDAPEQQQVPNEMLAVLSQCLIDGNLLKLPCQLDRKLYTKIDALLKDLGGKWNRKAGGHVFEEDPSELIDNIIVTGRTTKPEKFGFFPTPKPLAMDVVDKANIRPGMRILEPSAGDAGLADIIKEKSDQIFCCELQEKNVALLKDKGYQVVQGDFLDLGIGYEAFDRVVMNPPFEKQADIKHVLHAWNFLKPGGRLVAIMSSSVNFRQDKRATEFREFVDQFEGEITANPDGSFKSSGTAVNTVTLVIDKPAAA
ncbi:methyltransferase (plasmid) [Trichlorobacter lovleyi]|uniref:methyltransferase domain-containing protein n=1 Tax=Trichlorobacter lovleyi TaxID=313985 RepID=UPI00223EDE0C|nr:methyltransferase domain-containing protein [Trichlorobacter lovleyi]QOX80912.1 methyltransferase [Trichlorobacter lovleyi]